MAAKITRDIVECRLHCKLKAHLKLAGEGGNRCDYERLLLESRAEVRAKAIANLIARHAQEEVAREVLLTVDTLRQGSVFVIDTLLEDATLSLRFDGLKKVEGVSRLGDFHYVPILFHEGRKLGKEQRLLLELYGLLLSRAQERTPAYGLVLHGPDCRATRVKLDPDQRRANQLLRDLCELAGGEAAPKLLLNDHCQVCEFRQRCHEQAVKEDNLSLLRGLSEKEVKNYARKGILTLTQLAHTFKPRRKGKRQVKNTHHRYHALQALAIRDKKIYVFGSPELPSSPVRIYLDLEGDPDEGSVYLIGMLVVRDGTETRFAFWADNKDQESDIFGQFLVEVSRFDAFSVYC
jgi:predicted RecB family nuclease